MPYLRSHLKLTVLYPFDLVLQLSHLPARPDQGRTRVTPYVCTEKSKPRHADVSWPLDTSMRFYYLSNRFLTGRSYLKGVGGENK